MPSTSSDNSQLHAVTKSKEQALVVHHKHLNAYNELKRIFGSRTIQAEQKLVKSYNFFLYWKFNLTFYYFVVNLEREDEQDI